MEIEGIVRGVEKIAKDFADKLQQQRRQKKIEKFEREQKIFERQLDESRRDGETDRIQFDL